MRIFTTLILAGALQLAGCASPAVYELGPHISSARLSSNTTVVVDDKRPDSDRNHSYGSFFFGSSDYGVLTLGDVSFKPLIMDAVRSRILQAAATMPQAPARIEITVDRLIVQDNKQATFLQGSGAALGFDIYAASLIRGEFISFDYDKTRPFIIAQFKGKITVDGEARELVVTKINNYRHQNDAEAQRAALRKTMEAFLSEFSDAVIPRQGSRPPTSAQTNFRSSEPPKSPGASAKPSQEKAPEQKFGKYSYEVEKMAKPTGCKGGSGAYLTTDAGPIEDYRIDCESGTVYLARCEYGKCTAQ